MGGFSPAILSLECFKGRGHHPGSIDLKGLIMQRWGSAAWDGVPDFVIPWTLACKAPLSVRFSSQENWSGASFPSPEDMPNPGIKPGPPILQADSLLSEPPGKTSLFSVEI